jgi:hypothetical protein
MSDPTPPGALPTIRAGMRIALTLESLIALIGGVVFCTFFYLKVDRIERQNQRIMAYLGLFDEGHIPTSGKTASEPHPHGATP